MTGTLISDRYCRPDDESFMLGRGTNPFLVCFAGIVLLPANARAGKRRDRPAVGQPALHGLSSVCNDGLGMLIGAPILAARITTVANIVNDGVARPPGDARFRRM